MTLQERARELDQKYVPVLAARTRTAIRQLATGRRVLAEQKRRVAETSPAELDERYAASGLLHAIREIPQLGFVVIAAVFLAGTATAVVRHQPRPPGQEQLADPIAVAGSRLGPEIGETTAGYESTSTRDLEQLAEQSPGSKRLALVTFAAYQTPSQVEALLDQFAVRRIYLRAKVGGPDAALVPYDIRGELAESLRKAYADVAMSRLAARQGFLAYVKTTEDDKAFQADYAAYAASTGREVIAYQHSCACVFNAIVEAPIRDLVALSAHRSVRAVQVAGANVELAALIVQPLLPETTGLVTKGPATVAPVTGSLEVTVVGPEDGADLAAVYALRHEVFVIGQNVPAELELDEIDPQCDHAVATLDGEVVGTGRLLPTGIIGRMAVAEGRRGGGIGAAVLAALERRAHERGHGTVELHAQLHAAGFYDRAGYERVSDVYLEAGIEHVTMRKRL